jgi:hypothetical protein
MSRDLDADLVEYTGSTKANKADPKGKPAAKPAPLADELAEPAPSVAVYVAPKAGASHPKISRKAVAERLDNAEAALNAATIELTASRAALRSAEHDEGDALSALTRAMPGPTPDELLRAHAKAQLQLRADRVSRNESPEIKPVLTARSPLDMAAALRPKTNAQQPTAPLRSAIVRR